MTVFVNALIPAIPYNRKLNVLQSKSLGIAQNEITLNVDNNIAGPNTGTGASNYQFQLLISTSGCVINSITSANGNGCFIRISLVLYSFFHISTDEYKLSNLR